MILMSFVWTSLFPVLPTGLPWQPSWMATRDDLMCDCSKIKSENFPNKKFEDCCTCNAYTSWEGTQKDLYIEYVSLDGNSVVISKSKVVETDVYQIIHNNQIMTMIPGNICDNYHTSKRMTEVLSQHTHNFDDFRDKIVKINLAYNEIKELGNINCLRRLDELDLSFNRLTYLSNVSFSNLTFLRIININNNLIQKMDPAVISSPFLSLLSIELQNNKLDRLDITNMISLTPFCNLNYKNNQMTEIINQIGFKLEQNATLGHGFVSIEDNDFTQMPDFKEILGLQSLSEIGKVWQFGFSFLGMPINCDCRLQPLMNLSRDILGSIWQDYMDVKCFSPEDLKGISVYKVPMERFICPLKETQHCPRGCKCVDKPDKDTLFINCSGNYMTKLPNALPISKFSKYIHLDVSANCITEINITEVSYLANLSVLDLSGNHLEELGNDVVSMLEKAAIDVSDNPKLHRLPQRLRYRKVCSVCTTNLLLNCDCDSLWIAKWLKNRMYDCNTDHVFQCLVPGHESPMKAVDFSVDMLQCIKHDNSMLILTRILGGIVVALVISASLLFKFRYEILITLLRMRRQTKNAIHPEVTYDVFLSFDDENDDLRRWVNHKLVPKLTVAGYKTFLTYRDMPFGGDKDSATISVIKDSHNFLLILSESYIYLCQEGHSWTSNEWKYGWNAYKGDRTKNIVVINYDHVSSFDVEERKIKAFLRVGNPTDFLNRQRDIVQQVMMKLGPPISNWKRKQRFFENKKPRLTTDIFHVKQSVAKNKIYNIQDIEINTGVEKAPKDEKLDDKRKTQMTFDKEKDNYKETTGDFTITEKPRPSHGPLHYYF